VTTGPADLPARLGRMFPHRADRCYVAAKVRSDPLYGAIYDELSSSNHSLLDIGCGLGLLAFYLRERGLATPVTGLDYDARKIAVAARAAADHGCAGVVFRHHDARHGLPAHHGDVTILDILQFFTPPEQEALLAAAVQRVAPGGKLLVRTGLHDRSWRFRLTVAGDFLAKLTRWMKAAPIQYPTRATFEQALAAHGFLTIRPLWGATPFNNYLVVLRRPGPAGGS
jgi:2-polyprenyl-3-methyl-5-hydroxy-6-metoxy-1,4-benzoquinol methylase